MATLKICAVCGGENVGENPTKCRFCGESLAVKNTPVNSAFVRQSAPEKKQDGMLENLIKNGMPFMDAQALLKMGMGYANGVGGMEKNPTLAYQLFRAAALKGNREAMFRLGELLEKVVDGEEEAVYWYVQAARLGNIEARNTLAERLGAQLEAVSESSIYNKNGALKSPVSRVRQFCCEIVGTTTLSQAAQGSGCVVGKYIITNAHVVINDHTNAAHRDIKIDFVKSIDSKRYTASVVCFDGRQDVAICEFSGTAPRFDADYPKLVSASGVECGDSVFTIGNALGRGLSLSSGVIARDIMHNVYGKSQVIQTDMSMNGGNSGGALFNAAGEIIGLMTSVPADNQGVKQYGLSYAITSDTVIDFAKKNRISLQ